MSTDLHLLLAGPFVLCDDKDCFRILIPDLMNAHYKPGFTATHNSAELDNGVWKINPGKTQAGELEPKGVSLDNFCCSRPSNSRAYAVLELPRPDSLFGIYPTHVKIGSGSKSISRKEGFATRAVLVYKSVDLTKVATTPNLKWNPEGGDKPDVDAIGSVGLLVFDMRPIAVPTDDEHDRMAYRNMARMVGVDRYMSAPPHGIKIERGKYNDCGAALMLVSPEKLGSRK
jgi:hypothetical protein